MCFYEAYPDCCEKTTSLEVNAQICTLYKNGVFGIYVVNAPSGAGLVFIRGCCGGMIPIYKEGGTVQAIGTDFVSNSTYLVTYDKFSEKAIIS